LGWVTELGGSIRSRGVGRVGRVRWVELRGRGRAGRVVRMGGASGRAGGVMRVGSPNLVALLGCAG
jgi:hypothetical protein